MGRVTARGANLPDILPGDATGRASKESMHMVTDQERIAALEARVAQLEGLLEEVVSYEVKDGEEDDWINWLYDDWMDRVVEALDEPPAA
jgi:hypothetical protein